MAMTVSQTRLIHPKPGKNETKGKTIGTVVGLGAGALFENRPASTLRNLDWIVDGISKSKRSKAKLAATGIGLGIVAIIGAMGRFAGGLIGKKVDKHLRIKENRKRFMEKQNQEKQNKIARK